MQTFVGIFHSDTDAEAALQDLVAQGFSQDQFVLLTPELSSANLTPNSPKLEPLGACGVTSGHVAGAMTGFASGVLGGAMMSFMFPGVGPIIAMGAFALGGSFGAVAGGLVGNWVQETYAPTLPPEDLFIYESALRQGAQLLVIQPSNDQRALIAQDILNTHNATSPDDAWARWWQQLCEHEAAVHQRESSFPFAQIEQEFRKGFQAALDGRLRGKPTADQEALLTQFYGEVAQAPFFRQGFTRGDLYYHALLEHGDPKRTKAFASI